MSWRTVYINSHCHISFKNNYLVVKGEDIKMVHISEINTVIIDNNISSVSIYLLNELIKSKVKVIICDEKHDPSFELTPYYGSFDTSKMIIKETNWDKEKCDRLWTAVVKHKIINQAKILQLASNKNSEKLLEYSKEVVLGDSTNREGHAAKVYFNALFGNGFVRDDETNKINSYLNYGYSILLSMINRCIVSNGYLTQIGIHHRGYNNPFNLSCDLMEPFRPIIDWYVYSEYKGDEFTTESKLKMINYLNSQFLYEEKKQYLTNIIGIYVNKILAKFEEDIVEEEMFDYEFVKE